jgi:uncharacterized protein with von Willebrand factor type A (vWA) domain
MRGSGTAAGPAETKLLLEEGRYEPTARAMAAAMPYVDRLAPAHNLEALERLLPLLSA